VIRVCEKVCGNPTIENVPLDWRLWVTQSHFREKGR